MKRLSVLGLLLALVLVLGGVWASGAATSRYAYHWPVKPFDRQHPIRGAFGDPRTLATDQTFGVTGPRQSGSYSIHGGVDIVARPGAPVYPVVSGRVVLALPHKIVVHCSNGRAFQYWHLRGNVRRGQDVVAERTVLGWIQRPFDHVHLTEIVDHREQNPLADGHLEPYRDDTTPRAIALDVVNGRSPQLMQGGLVGRHYGLAIEAVDEPAIAVPGPFAGLPQTPALVEWRLRDGDTWSPWHVAVDFRRTVPAGRAGFWGVYAPGTFQNSPIFQRQMFEGVSGRYLFRIGLDPSRLRPGRYEVEAKVADVRGNASTTTWPIQVESA